MQKIHAVFLIGVLLTTFALGFQTLTLNSFVQHQDTGLPQGPRSPFYGQPLIFRTLEYAENTVGESVLVPNATIIGPNYRLVGVIVSAPPHLVTNDVGVTHMDWSITFLLSDKAVANGTTTFRDLAGHLVFVQEGNGGTFDSHAAALDLYNAAYFSTQSYQLIEVRNVWMVAHSNPPSVDMYIGNPVYRVISISGDGTPGDLDYSRMIALANSTIP